MRRYGWPSEPSNGTITAGLNVKEANAAERLSFGLEARRVVDSPEACAAPLTLPGPDGAKKTVRPKNRDEREGPMGHL